MTILLSAPITHLRSVPTQTNVLQMITFPLCSKTVFFSTMCFCLFLKLCYYPCRVASCCRAQTEKVITPVSSLHVYMKVADLNGISFHFFKKWTGTPSFSLKLALCSHSLPTLSHNFPTQTSLSTPPRHETPLTQKPPVPVQIKTLYLQLLKASFLLCIFKSNVFLWTGVIITLVCSHTEEDREVFSLYQPSTFLYCSSPTKIIRDSKLLWHTKFISVF